jgi:hypothetical protein
MGSKRSSFVKKASSQTWLTNSSQGALWLAQGAFNSVMPLGDEGTGQAFAGFTKSSFGGSAIGVAGAAIGDDGSRSCFGLYSDVQFEAGTYGYGAEIVVKHKAADKTTTPYSGPTGSTYGIQLNGGGDSSYGGAATGPSTAGIIFVGAEGWNRGIVFYKDSITGTDGSTGTGVAIEMAHSHLMQWRNENDVVANIGITGTGSNVDIVFTPAGTGKMRFGTHTGIAAETVTGYITVKDSGGTDRKIAVVS